MSVGTSKSKAKVHPTMEAQTFVSTSHCIFNHKNLKLNFHLLPDILDYNMLISLVCYNDELSYKELVHYNSQNES